MPSKERALPPRGASSRIAEALAQRKTFAVHDVPPANETLSETAPKAAIEMLSGGPIEACSDYRGTLAGCRFHPLVEAAWAAYDHHRPLVLSPDIIWITIAQGLATHINENTESLRHRFVGRSGKETIIVIRDDFLIGSPENPWDDVIDEFSGQIGDRIGPNHGLFVADFSTTGKVERLASEIVLMGAMRGYFTYELHTRCGIPTVTLEGTTEDWAKVRSRLDSLDGLGLEWWSSNLRPILDEFVRASNGDANRPFWGSMFKQKEASGGPYLTGWLLRFFPYLQEPEYEPEPSYRRTGGWVQVRNRFLAEGAEEQHFGGVRAEELPSGLAAAPFKWMYLGSELDYEFIAGLIGLEQDRATRALRPKVGWAVRPFAVGAAIQE